MCHFFLGPDPFPLEYVYYLIASGTMLFLGCLIGGAWFIWQRYKGTRQPITNGLNNPEVEGRLKITSVLDNYIPLDYLFPLA